MITNTLNKINIDYTIIGFKKGSPECRAYANSNMGPLTDVQKLIKQRVPDKIIIHTMDNIDELVDIDLGHNNEYYNKKNCHVVPCINTNNQYEINVN